MEQKVCFLVCPIGATGSETRKKADLLLEQIISPIVVPKGYEVIRADRVLRTDVITDTIINYLNNAELVIADLSVANPNVYYELGYRTALKKSVVQIAEDGSELPFDISTKRTFFYDMNDLQSVADFKNTISEVIDNLEKEETELKESTDKIGKEFAESFGTLLAAGVAVDIVNNPKNSRQYVDMMKDLKKIKEIGDAAKRKGS